MMFFESKLLKKFLLDYLNSLRLYVPEEPKNLYFENQETKLMKDLYHLTENFQNFCILYYHHFHYYYFHYFCHSNFEYFLKMVFSVFSLTCNVCNFFIVSKEI